MCRSIKQLRNTAQPPSDAEIEAAALQFVRKISGYRQPSRANRAGFDLAVAEIAATTRHLLAALGDSEGAHSHAQPAALLATAPDAFAVLAPRL